MCFRYNYRRVHFPRPVLLSKPKRNAQKTQEKLKLDCRDTHIRSHEPHDDRRDEARQGGSGVGDAEEGAGVVGCQVGVVDHVGGEGKASEAYGTAEREDGDVLVVAVHVGCSHQKHGWAH